jgi:hypothetical protein
MNANFGLLDPLPAEGLPRAQRGVKKDRKKELLVERAQADFAAWLDESDILSRGRATAKTHHRGTEDAEGSLTR